MKVKESPETKLINLSSEVFPGGVAVEAKENLMSKIDEASEHS